MEPSMDLTLTWDLLIIVFMAIVVAYSFIVGRHQSMKIIISTYIAIVAVQGLGGVVGWLFTGSSHMLSLLGLPTNLPMLAGAKLLLFTACIIILTVRSGISIEEQELGGILGVLFTGAFGFATAALLLTTLITYIAGYPLLDPLLAASPDLLPLLAQSRLIGVLVSQQHLWFALPAVLLVANGFLGPQQDEE